jgi:serine/threonine-protein kinase RsbW
MKRPRLAADTVSLTNLQTAIDDLHDVFHRWGVDGTFAGQLNEFAFMTMRLALHEWVANLVQHATFSTTTPEIRLRIQSAPKGVHCLIEDNSDGFDFRSQLYTQHQISQAPEPAERGRGLLMLIACTRDLNYSFDDADWKRLEFHIAGTDEPCIEVPF